MTSILVVFTEDQVLDSCKSSSEVPSVLRFCLCLFLEFIFYTLIVDSVNILLIGYDKETCSSLYYMDYNATLHKVDKCMIKITSRLVMAPPNFVIKIVDKDGAREYAWCESVKDAAIASASRYFPWTCSSVMNV
ncbi:Proteasome subunit beta type-2-A [Hibiscus syriacus]|uniref:Proteasome subunit beta type-2-A n=1 Tax=Hibiscus syriacus TaxID=106335 RepID=A0A6A3A5Z4_HIBSY|nr:Proteasome subunit beta type-2-A [Hibiscus syriacus]